MPDGTLLHLRDTWEAPADLAAQHGQVFQAAIAAYQAAEPGPAEELWEKVRAVWSHAWAHDRRLLLPPEVAHGQDAEDQGVGGHHQQRLS